MPVSPALVLLTFALSDSRAGVEAALARLEKAVLAGDPAAYMDGVTRADAIFRKEQENWALDLKRHVPREFDLSVGNPMPKFEDTFGAERAEFTLEMTFRIDAGHAKEDGGRAVLPVVFVLEDPDGDGPRTGEWLFAGERWLIRPCDGFDIRYFPGSEAVVEMVARAYPVAKAHDDVWFGVAGVPPQQIKLYQNMEHLKALVYLSMPDKILGGWNEPDESIKFMDRYTHSEKGWTRAFAHEYGHVATWALGPKCKEMPWWVTEGAAELAAEAFDTGGGEPNDRFIRGLAKRGDLAAWEDLRDYDATPAPIKQLAYHQGRHMMRYITRRWDSGGRNAWLRALAAGRSLEDATREQFGLGFAELDSAWRATLKEEKP